MIAATIISYHVAAWLVGKLIQAMRGGPPLQPVPAPAPPPPPPSPPPSTSRPRHPHLSRRSLDDDQSPSPATPPQEAPPPPPPPRRQGRSVIINPWDLGSSVDPPWYRGSGGPGGGDTCA
ncbi:uncharacterized protein LOC144620788 [Crassostrea virginica]